jgi:hypothetical protein
MSRYYGPIIAALVLTVFSIAPVAEAKKLSGKTVAVTQLKIVHTGQAGGSSAPSSWGIDSNYIGPGDIARLIAVDIYLDNEKRIAYIKITRESYTGDLVTFLFSDVKEISIQTLKPGDKRPHKKVPVSVHTADSLTFP